MPWLDSVFCVFPESLRLLYRLVVFRITPPFFISILLASKGLRLFLAVSDRAFFTGDLRGGGAGGSLLEKEALFFLLVCR